MQIEQELVASAPGKDTLLTVGVFDGVHLGHKYLLSQLKEQARQQNLLSGVVTFRQHPEEILSEQTRLPFLTGLSQRIEALKREGVDMVVVLSFTPEMAQLPARQFVGLLQNHLRMRGLVIGHDFALGRDREGSADALRALGQEMNFSVIEVTVRLINGEVVSSTAIRKALADGDMKRVHRLIGRYFSLEGRVVTGHHLGAGLGFPTANLEIDPAQALPADGVYATRAYLGGKAYHSMTNIGTRPTFGGCSRSVEVYILDCQGNLYGQEIKIDIIGRVRDEKRFDSAEQLKQQITEDIKQGRAMLSRADRG